MSGRCRRPVMVIALACSVCGAGADAWPQARRPPATGDASEMRPPGGLLGARPPRSHGGRCVQARHVFFSRSLVAVGTTLARSTAARKLLRLV